MKPLRDSQWAAVRAADRHLLVVAGAGTGKTTTVVARILYLLGAEVHGERRPAPLRLREIGAITYTNAAAADLKRKLREELRRAGLRELAYEVDAARIGTIHGFCGDILREFALRAGRVPATRILEEGEGAALAAEVVRETIPRAIDEGTVPGLGELLAQRSLREVQRWVCRLVADSDRLDRIADAGQSFGPLEDALIELACDARKRVEDRLRAMGALDFDRMVVWTRDLLRHRDEIRRAVQRRLRALIVDEFQDVDPVQKEIAYLLGEPESRRDDTTRLMLVGDPKQSVYRFRRADVTVWREVAHDFGDGGLGDVVPLDDNFRSTAPVLAFVDAAIGPILDRPLDGEAHQAFEVAYRSVAATNPDGPADRAVELVVTPAGPDGTLPKAAEQRAMEAAAVARRAVKLREEGVRLREMAVLLASWSDLAIYQSALERAGLPTYALRTDGFYRRREVQDLVLALETVRDPRDDRALIGFLRSPFVGLRDDTLLRIARQTDTPYWDSLHELEVDEQPLLEQALTLLREHVALRDRLPTHELLARLLERSGYLAHLALLGPAGEQALANVRKFVATARRLPELSVGDFRAIMRDAADRGAREGDARLYGPRDDVVTLTSIHSAKGLEWDVVFWCDLNRRGGGADPAESLLVGRDRLALKEPDVASQDQPIPWRRLLQDEEAEAAAERKRLWYVAVTRARQRLILSGMVDGKAAAGSPAEAIARVLGEIPAHDGATLEYAGQGRNFTLEIRLAEAIPPVGDEREDGTDPWSVDLPGQLTAPAPPLMVPAGRPRHSATELMLYDRCPRRHWFHYVAGLKEPEVERSGGEFDGAVARGQIVHDVLERLETDAELDALLDEAVGRWDDDTLPPDSAPGARRRHQLIEDVKENVRRVADDPEYRAIDDNPTRRRELPFLHIIGPGSYVDGRIDLAAREEDGLVLLDVKTHQGDAVSAEIKARQYALQRDAYLSAAEAIGGEPVARFAFQFSGAGFQLSKAVDADVRREARDTVERLIGTIGRGEPALTRHPAECRYCGYRQVGWCPGVPESAD